MSSYFENNLVAIQQQEQYHLLVDALLKNDAEQVDFQCGFQDIDEHRVMYVVKDNRSYQLDTLYDQSEYLNMWVNSQDFTGYGLKVIFYGIGNGMYAKKLIHTMDDTGRLIIYEPSMYLFREAMEHYDLTDVLTDERVTIVVQNLYDKMIHDLLYASLNYNDIKNMIYQSYPNYDRLFPEETKEFDNLIQTLIMQIRATQNVLGRYGWLNAVNALGNTEKFARSKSIYSFARICPRDIPFVIIASGPSLSKNVEVLKKLKGKAILCACDSALPALLRNEVIPDCFVTVDSNKHERHTADPRTHVIPVFCEMESKTFVINQQEGPVFFMNDMNPYINKYMRMKQVELPAFPSGGSVANTACAIATSMGFANIVFVGQDLAYSGGKMYADGTVGSERAVNRNADEEMIVKGYYGDQVSCSREFFLYRSWFEAEIVKNPDIHFINATEGGAYINGAEHISLEAVANRFADKEIDFEAIMQATSNLFDDDQRKEFSDYMLQLVPKLQSNGLEIREAIRCYEKIQKYIICGERPMGQIRKLTDRAAEITKRLEKDFAMYYVFCLAQQELQGISENLNDRADTVENDLRKMTDTGIRYLNVLEKNVENVIAHIAENHFNEQWTLFAK